MISISYITTISAIHFEKMTDKIFIFFIFLLKKIVIVNTLTKFTT